MTSTEERLLFLESLPPMSSTPKGLCADCIEAPEHCSHDSKLGNISSSVFTLTWLSSEREVTGGKTSVGKDCGVHPGQEMGETGGYVRNVLEHVS